MRLPRLLVAAPLLFTAVATPLVVGGAPAQDGAGDDLAAQGRELYLTYQVHNESIVIPETIDCIRALTAIEPDGAASIAKTDAALGVTRHFLRMESRAGSDLCTQPS